MRNPSSGVLNSRVYIIGSVTYGIELNGLSVCVCVCASLNSIHARCARRYLIHATLRHTNAHTMLMMLPIQRSAQRKLTRHDTPMRSMHNDARTIFNDDRGGSWEKIDITFDPGAAEFVMPQNICENIPQRLNHIICVCLFVF